MSEEDEVFRATQEVAIGIHLDASSEQVEGCRRILEQEYEKWMTPMARQDVSFPDLWLGLQRGSASGQYGKEIRLLLTEDEIRRWMRFKTSELNAAAFNRAAQAEATRCQATIHLLALDLTERAGMKHDDPFGIDVVIGALRDRGPLPATETPPVIIHQSDPEQVN